MKRKFIGGLNEAQIKKLVSQMTKSTDDKFIHHKINIKEHEKEIIAIRSWETEEYKDYNQKVVRFLLNRKQAGKQAQVIKDGKTAACEIVGAWGDLIRVKLYEDCGNHLSDEIVDYDKKLITIK